MMGDLCGSIGYLMGAVNDYALNLVYNVAALGCPQSRLINYLVRLDCIYNNCSCLNRMRAYVMRQHTIPYAKPYTHAKPLKLVQAQLQTDTQTSSSRAINVDICAYTLNGHGPWAMGMVY